MKNMRKLIPAIAMLLVSAVMMSTASFAWFTSASNASAEGMQVKAVADGGLAIGAWTDDANAPVGTAFYSSVKPGYADGMAAYTADANGVFSATLKPATHSGSGWYQSVGTQVDNHASTGTYTADSTNYIHTKFDIKALAPGKTYTLKVAGITVGTSTGTTAALNEALRVAICVDGNWYYFAPTRDTSDRTTGTGAVDPFKYYNGTSGPASYDFASTTATGADNKGKIATATLLTSGDIAISDTLTENAKTVDVYIYYEGEDFACVSAYALSTNSLVPVTINFTATEKVSSGT